MPMAGCGRMPHPERRSSSLDAPAGDRRRPDGRSDSRIKSEEHPLDYLGGKTLESRCKDALSQTEFRGTSFEKELLRPRRGCHRDGTGVEILPTWSKMNYVIKSEHQRLVSNHRGLPTATKYAIMFACLRLEEPQ